MKKSIIIIVLLSVFGFVNTVDAQMANKANSYVYTPLNWMDIPFNGNTMSCRYLCAEGSLATLYIYDIVDNSLLDVETQYFNGNDNQVDFQLTGFSGNVRVTVVLDYVVHDTNVGDFTMYTVNGGSGSGYINSSNSLYTSPVVIHAVPEGMNGL